MVSRISAIALGALLIGSTWLLVGNDGFAIALAGLAGTLIFLPRLSPELVMRMVRAVPLAEGDLPWLWRDTARLAARAKLSTVPRLYLQLGPGANAMTTGDGTHSAIALTEDLLQNLSRREIEGVIAHEVAHLARDDTRRSFLNEMLAKLTFNLSVLALWLNIAEILISGGARFGNAQLIAFALAPIAAILILRWGSRAQEFAADQFAAALTGDPDGIIRALTKVDRINRGWLRSFRRAAREIMLPGLLHTHPALAARIRRLSGSRSGRPAPIISQPLILNPSPIQTRLPHRVIGLGPGGRRVWIGP